MPVISGSSPAYRDDIARPPQVERPVAASPPGTAPRPAGSDASRIRSPAGLRVCLLAPAFYGWGQYDGAGRATRMLGRELARRGARVTAVVPRRHGQRDVEVVDGITVLGYPERAPWRALALARQCDADIYHSQELTAATALAAAARPRRRHAVTLRDLATIGDLARGWRALLPTLPGAAATLAGTADPLRWLAALRADGLYCAAESLMPLALARFRRREVRFLPTPVPVPRRVQKARVPTVCFIGPWEPRHHPERALALAARFPAVRFVALGRSPDREHDAALRRAHERHANLRFMGPVNQFRSDLLSQLLSESWVLVSPAHGRGLPDACVEGAAHACALLSDGDPDGFASRFGHHAADGDLVAGLDALLADGAWRERGAAGHAHALATFDIDIAVARHLEAYESLGA